MRGNISKSKGFKGDKGDAFSYEDFTPEQLETLVGAQGKKGDTPNIEFTYDKATGDLYYSSDGVLVGESYISSENLATKDDVNGEIRKISADLIIEVEDTVRNYEDLLVYDKHGRPTKDINDVHAGIFRFNVSDSNSSYEQTMPCLLVQNKNIVTYKKTSSLDAAIVYQEIVSGDGMLMFRAIENLNENIYQVFEDYTIKPYDELDEFGSDTQPLSARQGYVLDQKKADKEEVSATRDEILTTLSKNLATKENSSNKVTVIDDGSNDILYPSSKAVKTYVDGKTVPLKTGFSNLQSALNEKSDKSETDEIRSVLMKNNEKFLEKEDISNKSALIDDSADEKTYPSTKAVKDFVSKNVCNPLKCYATGNPIILNDVSTIEHEMKVMTSVGGATVTRTGKNLVDAFGRTLGILSGYDRPNLRTFEFDKYYIGLSSNNYYDPSAVASVELVDNTWHITGKLAGYGLSFPLKVLPNTQYYASATRSGGYFIVSFYDKNGAYTSAISTVNASFTTPENCEVAVLHILPSANGGKVQVSDIQIEVGTEKTKYEPYVESTVHIADENGNVNGVTSVYPTTVLSADTDNTITVEYSRDINKVIANLENAILTLGGNS